MFHDYTYGFTLLGIPGWPEHLAILGRLLLITGFANFDFNLVLHGPRGRFSQ